MHSLACTHSHALTHRRPRIRGRNRIGAGVRVGPGGATPATSSGLLNSSPSNLLSNFNLEKVLAGLPGLNLGGLRGLPGLNLGGLANMGRLGLGLNGLGLVHLNAP